MLRAFLFADPAAHSRSPAMHTAAFAAAGLAGTYEARRVPAEQLAGAVGDLRAPGVLGANISLPHKEAVPALLDDLTDAARAIGAVNTIIRRGESLVGDNTDAPGMMAALRNAGAPSGGPAVVLGAGGAARAAVYALQHAGHEVYVWNRTLEKAERLARDFATPTSPARAAAFERVPWTDVTLLINATSAGLNAPSESPLPSFPALSPSAFVYDMVYAPEDTRLVRDAREHGVRAESGLTMLAQQARLSFLAWTDVDIPVDVFLGAARQAHQGTLK